MTTNTDAAVQRVLFRAPVKLIGSDSVIDLNHDGTRDCFHSTLLRNYGEPLIPAGTMEAILERGETVSKKELGDVKVSVLKSGLAFGNFPDEKSLDWVTKHASPVAGGQWALQPDGQGGLDYIITK